VKDLVFEEIEKNAPKEEPARQLYFIEALRSFVEMKKGEGYEAKAMVSVIGCQMSAKDGEKLQGILEEAGFQSTESEEEADVILFTTCTVRENANQKLYGRIGQLKHLYKKNKDMVIGITGCMMQEKDEVETIQKKYPYVHLIFGTHNIYKLAELLLEALLSKERKVETWEDTGLIVENLPSKRKYPFRASVNISFGCNNFCTYCIVPYVRGREKSRDSKEIVKECKALVQDGVKEIMLLGQNVNSYGLDRKEELSFPALLREVAKIPGLRRIRFMTPNPKDFSDELLSVIKENENICNHIPLPLQSGSTAILKRMNRHYTKESYLSLLRKIKESLPDLGLTTDIIVGFPGETEEDFQDTLSVVREAQFDSAFTFQYSKRSGTPAAKWEAVDEKIVAERFQRLLDTVRESSKEREGKDLGKVMEVLVEERNTETNMLTGRLENNILVHFEGGERLLGEIVPVKLEKSMGFYYYGSVV